MRPLGRSFVRDRCSLLQSVVCSTAYSVVRTFCHSVVNRIVCFFAFVFTSFLREVIKPNIETLRIYIGIHGLITEGCTAVGKDLRFVIQRNKRKTDKKLRFREFVQWNLDNANTFITKSRYIKGTTFSSPGARSYRKMYGTLP